MEEYRLYTIKDLKDWILDGKSNEGLSKLIITTTRAYSFINNPYVTDEMPVVSALFVEGELAAYTAAFPERLRKPNCLTHWFNSLFVDPKYEGKGYGMFVLGSLMECYGNDPVFDLDAVDTSVQILEYLGLLSTSFTQYDFRNKNINRNSWKGEIAFYYDRILRARRSKSRFLEKSIKGSSYTLEYDDFVDAEAYEFIITHSKGDAFLREREALNWMLRFPFVHEAPIKERVRSSNLFSSAKTKQRYFVVKVLVKSELIGVYVLCDSSTRLSLLGFYYEPNYLDEVLYSIVQHIMRLDNPSFSTTDKNVADFIRKKRLFLIDKDTRPSFCYPKEFNGINKKQIQGWDGDMFLN